MNKRPLCALAVSFLLASCGGSSSSPVASSVAPAGDSSSVTPQPSSSSSEAHKYGTWAKDTASHTFPTQYGWDYEGTLPTLTDKLVAFCPKDTKFANVYTWDDSFNNPHGQWPGTKMTTTSNYDSDWYEVEIENYSSLNIIFNNPGQTKDMKMTHAGYWWFWNSDKDIHDTAPEAAWIDAAKFTAADTVNVVANVNFTSLALYKGNEKVIEASNPGTNAVNFFLDPDTLDLGAGYHVKATLEGGIQKEMEIDVHYLYNLPSFDAKYAYDGNDLGAVYTKEKTTFKVWSPFSKSIVLKLYRNGTPVAVDPVDGSDAVYKTVEMKLGEKGVWSATVEEDLDGFYYTYAVTNSTYENMEVVDPYAKSAGANGKRGMILDFAKTNPEGWDQVAPHQYDRKELTVWECHIADLTSSSTWTGSENNRKRYGGFHEAGTTYTEEGVTVKTGFDHVKELGVNAVQILPMFDQDNDELHPEFNWGYNPLNYNVPEGVYSANPRDGALRVKELKALIKDYNAEGINIIMDVVYNHVAGANKSNFDVLMPGYYFRYSSTGVLTNGSGCGNETASEHKMMRKFIVDSTSFWAKEYKLGGFRFDLMALHDLDTMAEVVTELEKFNPKAVVYGEPWTGGTSPLDPSKAASQSNGNKYQGYGQFNDGMRDALIKGGMNSYTATGWTNNSDSACEGELPAIFAGIKGFTKSKGEINDPDKTVNYVTCHDNFTIYDRNYVVYPRTSDKATSLIKRRATLANSVVFTSQGTTFMLSGDEFLRTKPDTSGDSNEGKSHNSYNKSYECNQLDYALKIKHRDSVENYKKLIEFKQTVDGLHLGKDDAAKIKIDMVGKAGFAYEVKDSKNNRTYKIVHHNGFAETATVDFTGYSLYLETLGLDGFALSDATPVSPYQTIIAYK